jgi:hypothetical protein
VFGGEVDPLALLQDMERVGPADATAQGALQPFQIFRQVRLTAAAGALTMVAVNHAQGCSWYNS